MPEPDPLLALFAEYNPAIWPLQLVAYAGAAGVSAREAGAVTDRIAPDRLVIT